MNTSLNFPSAHTRKDISTLVEGIPSDNARFKDIKNIKSELSLEVRKAVISFLSLFNSIDLKKKGNTVLIRSKSFTAYLFHQSVARYLLQDDFSKSFINSWKRLSKQDDDVFSIADGVNLLYHMEKARVDMLGDTVPIRFVSVAQAVIKANVKGYDEPMYLYQLDQKINQYQLIGGRKDDIDNNLQATMIREMKEELYKNKFIKNEEFELKQLIDKSVHYEVSPTFGGYSEYTFAYYQMFFGDEDIKMGGGDAWISNDEMVRGYAKDGKKIRLTFQQSSEIDFSKLPLSTSRVQPEFHSDAEGIGSDTKSSATILDLIEGGESDTLEFKSSARWDYRRKQISKDLEKVIIKTIAGFLNGKGGTLILGIDDDGSVLGLKKDLKTLRTKSMDGYMQYLTSLISEWIGVEYLSNIDFIFEKFREDMICLIKIRNAYNPVFIKDKTVNEFYVRSGNTTKLLDSAETYKYLLKHR